LSGLRDEDPARRDACAAELSARWEEVHEDLARAAAFEELRTARAASTCLNVRRHLHPWRCGAEGCTLARLGLCYVQGDGLVGADVTKGLPAPLAGGESAALPF
jgi:hypothetical protein